MKTDIKHIKFDDRGLIPAIAQDAVTGEILMQAFMNEEALQKTLSTGKAHYYSRSRQKLWLKGETSGHFQHVVSVYTDCDNDCILIKVVQDGNACHTGSYSCFFNELKEFEEYKGKSGANALFDCIATIKDRADNPEEGSYTNYLLEKGREKICKKIGEESSEVIIAAMKGDNDELKNELSDLFYHAFVLMKDRQLDFSEVLDVLHARHSAPRKRNY